MVGFHAGCLTVSPCLLFFFFFFLLAAQSGPVLPLSSDLSSAKWPEGAAQDGGGHVIYSQAGDTTNSTPSTAQPRPSTPGPGLPDDTAARFLPDSAD